MSLVGLGHVCSHLQNVTRVNLALTSIPMTKLHMQIALGLYKEGFISSVQRGDREGPDEVFTPNTMDNISQRRIWLGLKYHNFNPVLKSMQLVSKPSRRVYATEHDLQSLVSGRSFRLVKPLQMGEVMFVRTKEGAVMDIQEAVGKRLSGEILCRVK